MRGDERLIVGLGQDRYGVERPFGDLSRSAGKVTDVAVDSRGRIFGLLRSDPLAGPRSDCVVVLDPDGACLGAWGGERIADAHMIACDAQDRLWIVDRDAHEVVCFDADGREVGTLGRRHRPGEPFNHPSDIAFAPDGSIYIADGYANGFVHRFAPDGHEAGRWGDVGKAPGAFMTAHGIAVAADGRVLVADRENNRVQVFDPDGKLLAIWSEFQRPSDIFVDAAGDIFVSDAIPTLSRFAPDGIRTGRCRPVLNGAHGICGDAQGRIYLAEGTPSRLTRLAPIGR